jgi:hypothetical protein
VAGLQDTFVVVSVLIGLTLLLSGWEWVRPRRQVLRRAGT